MYKTLFVVTSVVSLALYSGTQLYNTPSVQEDTASLWSAWKAKQGKSYSSIEEDSYRYQVFLENYKFVKEYNARGRKAVMGLTQFADLTSEEFASFTGGLMPQPKLFEQTETVVLDEINIPASVDWVSQGAVTPIKNQGQCGSCWTFSTTGALEGLNFIKSGSLLSFSEQQILDCDKSCMGCNGGIPAYAMTYTAAHGIEPSSDYPYTAQQGDCQYNAGEAVAVNKAYSSITAHSTNALLAGIVQQPVSITVQANQQVFQMYTSGVITASDDCGAQCDHAVLAVGYGTYGGVQAFMVKNSWGQSWGDDGYLYISTDGTANGGAGVCGILSTPVIPTA